MKPEWLPDCFEHLKKPYQDETDETVTVARISDNMKKGYKGFEEIFSALVPLDRVEEVLNLKGWMNWRVNSSGYGPTIFEGNLLSFGFDITPKHDSEDKFRPLVVSWEHHNNKVTMPDSSLLMCYSLCPRILKDPYRLCWDDLSIPEYDVITVKPLYEYEFQGHESESIVTIKREYLEDYGSINSCAIVAFYYEERTCPQDDTLESRLDEHGYYEHIFPGGIFSIRKLDFMPEKGYRCESAGCRLILLPESGMDSRNVFLEDGLEWPGYEGVMTRSRIRSIHPHEYVYVKDEVLVKYEGKPDYQINPMSGSVHYDNIWDFSYCRRIGRDYIAYELKKLYEGCRHQVLQHIHQNAVSEEVAKKEGDNISVRNIGNRADELIRAYFRVGNSLSYLSDILGLGFSEEQIISLNPRSIESQGWWNTSDLVPLGYRAGREMTNKVFLERCQMVHHLFEGFKEKPLRKIMESLGINPEELSDLKSFTLLNSLISVCQIIDESGLNMRTSQDTIQERFDKDHRVELMAPLFALNDLRQIASHRPNRKTPKKAKSAYIVFGIQEAEMKPGWGLAVDSVYDKLIAHLKAISDLIFKICVDHVT